MEKPATLTGKRPQEKRQKQKQCAKKQSRARKSCIFTVDRENRQKA